MKILQKVQRAFLFLLLLAAFLYIHGGVVEITCSPKGVTAVQGEKIVLRFSLRNGSAYTLSQVERFFLSYHAYDGSGKLLSYDNRRFSLPQPVRPGRSAAFSVPVYFSLGAGIFNIEWELVREGEFWGRAKKWRSCYMQLRLRPLVSAAYKKAWLPTFYESGREWLDREQYLVRQVLRNNEVRLGGELFGFAAGSTYPQVWIRDTATLMFYARFFYPLPALQKILDLFFLSQDPGGQIQDWVDAAGRCDKNTVESDQESSLVLAAFQLALSDPAWLTYYVAGISRLRRLDMALEWLWRNRLDTKRGLIWSGFTADWGDVERSYADQRAIKLSDRSQRTYSTYSQALFIQAAEKLARIAERLGDKSKAGKWRQRGKAVAAECRRQLYLAGKGYFIVHRVENKDDVLSWERNILAVGGNAEAMRAGLMSKSEISRFLGVLEAKRKQLGLRSVSFTLLPPFPENFFSHPALRRPWSYQNGGEWDWIGGRLVSALYQSGFRREADKYLEEISTKNLADMNIFEWSDNLGNGQGASFYAGAAGVLGEAILCGHLGLQEDFDCYVILASPDPFTQTIAKENDRFRIENSQKVSVTITSLSKEIRIMSPTGRLKTIYFKKTGFYIVE